MAIPSGLSKPVKRTHYVVSLFSCLLCDKQLKEPRRKLPEVMTTVGSPPWMLALLMEGDVISVQYTIFSTQSKATPIITFSYGGGGGWSANITPLKLSFLHTAAAQNVEQICVFGRYRLDFKSEHAQELEQTSGQLVWKSAQQEKQTAILKLSD